ncbi:glycosyltransferase family 2 protein [Candidatus Woesearchaeota archaeon]|nr:glycosyltransferase family 2 protein [Candidatus Woesearchaeota archaeon]
MDITTIIPAYNEEKNVGEIVNGAKKHSNKVIVIVAKKSSDRTADIARDFGAEVIYDNGRGIGDAIKCGINHTSDDDIVVKMDCDCSHDFNDIPKLVKPILDGEADLVIGSRRKGGSDELSGKISHAFRGIATDLIVLAVNIRWNQQFTDIENGFRAARAKTLKDINLKTNDFDLDQETVMKMLKRGYRIKEVAAHEYPRKHGQSTMNLFRVGWKFVWSYMKYAFLGFK